MDMCDKEDYKGELTTHVTTTIQSPSTSTWNNVTSRSPRKDSTSNSGKYKEEFTYFSDKDFQLDAVEINFTVCVHDISQSGSSTMACKSCVLNACCNTICYLMFIQGGAIKTGPPSHCKYSEIP